MGSGGGKGGSWMLCCNNGGGKVTARNRGGKCVESGRVTTNRSASNPKVVDAAHAAGGGALKRGVCG